jgi:hypothetical protein
VKDFIETAGNPRLGIEHPVVESPAVHVLDLTIAIIPYYEQSYPPLYRDFTTSASGPIKKQRLFIFTLGYLEYYFSIGVSL